MSTRLLFIVLLLTTSFSLQAELFAPGEYDQLCDKLPEVSKTNIKLILRERESLLRKSEISLDKIQKMEYQDFSLIVEKSIKLGQGPLELFTDTEFSRTRSCAFLLTKDVLMEIDKNYNLHGLWMIRVSADDGSDLEMDFLIAGQGKLIIGYPVSQIVKVLDYNFFTGNYEYSQFITTDIVNESGRRGIFNLQSFDDETGQMGPFKGPMGASIQSLSNQDSKIMVKYQWIFEQELVIERIPINKR